MYQAYNKWLQMADRKCPKQRGMEGEQQIQDHRSFSSQTSDFHQKNIKQQYKLREVETAIEKN